MKYPRSSRKLIHGRLNSRFFNNSTVRRQASVKYGYTAISILRLIYRINKVIFYNLHILDIFLNCFSRYRHMSITQLFLYSLKYYRQSAPLVKLLHGIFAGRLQVAYIRNFLTYFIKVSKGQRNPSLICNRHQMKHCISR